MSRTRLRIALFATAIFGLMFLPQTAARVQDGTITTSGGALTLGNTFGSGTTTLQIFDHINYFHPAFFANEHYLSNGVYYIALPDGNPFGYYSHLGVYTFTCRAVEGTSTTSTWGMNSWSTP